MANKESTFGIEHTHKGMRKTDIEKNEKDVCEVVDVLKNHFVNPFDFEDKTGLYIISLGMKVPDEVANDILQRPVGDRSQRYIHL